MPTYYSTLLSVPVSLHAILLLCRICATTAAHLDHRPTNLPLSQSRLLNDLLLTLVVTLSYLSLFAQLALYTVYLAHTVLAFAMRRPHISKQTVHLIVLSLPLMVSNLSGIIDITHMPLVADLLLFVWQCAAVVSLFLAVFRFPNSTVLLPLVAMAASDLSIVLDPHVASRVLAQGLAIWGTSIVARDHLALMAAAVMALGIQCRRVWASSHEPLLVGELTMAVGAILGLLLWAAALFQLTGALLLRWRQIKVDVFYQVVACALACAYVARIWGSKQVLLVANALLFCAIGVVVVVAARVVDVAVGWCRAKLRERPRVALLVVQSGCTVCVSGENSRLVATTDSYGAIV
ncbi:hypothetical protein GGI25_005654 [Coemansia spiralis]|uniref:Uncharacterized protein n=2 Tax=Coemansia TaxID=4863 RepID=A0A9W8KUG9_9FUNG|nr:hypothetical protein EDC05_005709 [Coemansia umbellata]KAJ2618877.1 hypothetical protein GGI26_006287 [Coemansia sp. RSA 1358]KAJ2671005.1 hypothetical protein GGI25_005654 [Coemansia spiralis]